MSAGSRRVLWIAAVGAAGLGALYWSIGYRGALHSYPGPKQSEWQRQYWSAITRAENADRDGRWDEANRAYGQLVRLRPYDATIRCNRAAALAHLGRDHDALSELRRAVEFGWADLAALKSEPAFKRLRAASQFELLLERGTTIAGEPIALYAPAASTAESGAPLLIAFHGLGGNPHSFIQFFKPVADRLGIVVAAPRGIRRVGAQRAVHAFRWTSPGGRENDRDLRACKALVDESIALAKARANIDEDRIILAGYSQGGSVALTLLADAPERFCGAVVEATAWAPRLNDMGKSVHHRGSRVCVIVHELDRMRPVGEKAFRVMASAGINVRLMMVPGTDHELATDGGARLVEALRFVLRR